MSLLTLAQQTFELCAGESKTVNYYSNYGGSGNNVWSVNGLVYGDEDTLTYTFNSSGIYNIVLRRENVLCYVEQSIQVTVNDCPGIIYWVPNTFTPDGNEYNQTFGPVLTEGHDVDGFNFKIYNRWGQIIWESKDIHAKWDGYYNGRVCQDGLYTWSLELSILGNDGRIYDQGHLTIIR
jgi:hypothetical protein